MTATVPGLAARSTGAPPCRPGWDGRARDFLAGGGPVPRPAAGKLSSSPAWRIVVERIDRLPATLLPGTGALVTGNGGALAAFLPVGYWLDHVYIGPGWRPGAQGCPQCLLTRLANSPFGPDQRGGDVAAVLPAASGLPGGTAARRMVQLLAADRLEQATSGRASDLAVTVFDTTSFTLQTQMLVPDSTCPMCAQDAPGGVVDPWMSSVPTTKLAPATLRVRVPDDAALAERYLAGPLALFRGLRHDLQSPVGSCSVDLPSTWGRREPAIGRAVTYDRSLSIAVLEGLERYAGLHRGGRRRNLRATYDDLGERAVLPTTFGVHPESSYRTPGFRYRPFDPALPIDWVEAYSFRQDGPALVPERAAFWGPRGDREPSFFYDTSNGCAVGASVPEAVLHGLRELVERDSYLLTWYRQLRLPEIDLDTAGDPELRQLLRRTRLFTGCAVRAFQSTMEYQMPSVWLMALGCDPDEPQVITGSAAHPDPVQALVGGLYELVGSVLGAQHRYRAGRGAATEMACRPDLVVTMEDHSMAASVPEARERFAFLTDGEPSLAVSDLRPTVTASGDIRADLADIVDRLLALGLDVLVVDQTMPELGGAGTCCVKVLVPGLVPMTFGHVNRRTEHLPRLCRDYRLPYPSLLGPDLDLNVHPHPFP